MNQDFIYGADISSLLAVEELGGTFTNDNGEKEDFFKILKSNGFNLARIRLFVDPKSNKGVSYGAGHNDLETALTLAKRAKDHDFKVLLNIHYSDFWADENHQTLPKAWAKLDFADLEYQVYAYTKEVVTTFKEENITLDYIQVGNEVNKGILWPHGKLFRRKKATQTEYDALAILLNAGIKAIREVTPNVKIMIHLGQGSNPEMYADFLHFMEPRLFKFDAIGLSYYPYIHRQITELQATLLFIKTYYPYERFIVETSYPFENGDETSIVNKDSFPPKRGFFAYTPLGQERVLETILDAAVEEQITGLCYFEPGWINVNGLTVATIEGIKYLKEKNIKAGSTLFNEALFSRSGRPNPALSVKNNMDAFKKSDN